jgi:hypothetical protein
MLAVSYRIFHRRRRKVMALIPAKVRGGIAALAMAPFVLATSPPEGKRQRIVACSTLMRVFVYVWFCVFLLPSDAAAIAVYNAGISADLRFQLFDAESGRDLPFGTSGVTASFEIFEGFPTMFSVGGANASANVVEAQILAFDPNNLEAGDGSSFIGGINGIAILVGTAGSSALARGRIVFENNRSELVGLEALITAAAVGSVSTTRINEVAILSATVGLGDIETLGKICRPSALVGQNELIA